MNSSPKTHLCLLVVGVLLLGTLDIVAQSGRVLPGKRRTATLEEGAKWVDQMNPEMKASFSELRYPFTFKEKEILPEPVEVAPEAPKEPEFTDKEVLTAVAAKMNATGTMVRGDTSFLIFPKGNLPDGGAIKLTFRGKPYTVRVKNVNSSGYDLQLNDEVIRKSFGQKSSGTIERDVNTTP